MAKTEVQIDTSCIGCAIIIGAIIIAVAIIGC